MGITWGWDATHANLSSVPAGQGAGYTTGTPDIQWTDADWAAHPGAVRIDQNSGGSDPTADEIDDEPGADTDSGSVGWYGRALAARAANTRAGQRRPAFYRDLDGLPELAAAAQAANLGTGLPLHLADWNLTMDQAAAKIGTVMEPFTVIGVQFANRGTYDSDVWDSAWLADVSGGPTIAPEPPSSDTLAERLSTMPELAEGATGAAVGTLQSLLRNRGFHLGTTGPDGNGVDRDFGPLTHAAVVAFQQEQKIADDGIVGPITWPLLPLS